MQTRDNTASVDLLPGYTDTKLRLASIAEILLTIAQERKDEERVHTIQRLLADLAEDAFRVAVVGKYNRGKSSLMNAMLGHDWLPTGILPLTSVITTVRYGANQRVLIGREDSSLRREISLHDLPQYVTEELNPGNEKHVNLAEVQLPSDLLRYGFLFIDTPGLGSGIAANTTATQRFLPEIDAGIVVLSFESPLDDDDMDLLSALHRLGRKLFILLNKADLVSPIEQNRVAAFVSDRLDGLLNERVLLFPLSAREGLAARMRGDNTALERSGLKAFERQLVSFLATQKSELFLRRAIERTRELLEQEDLECFLAEELRSGNNKASLLSAIQAEKKTALAKVDEVFLRLGQQIPGLFVLLLDDDLRLWFAERQEEALAMTDENSAFLSRGLSEWIGPRLVLATGQLRETGAESLDQLKEEFQNLQQLGNQLLGRDVSDLQVDEYDLLYGIQERNVEIPKLPALQWSPPEWTRAIPLAWLRERVAARLVKSFLLATDAYLDAINPLLEQACRHWLERAERQAKEAIRSFASRLETIGSRSNTAETASVLRDLKPHLDDIAKSWRARGVPLPAHGNDSPSEVGNYNSVEFCFVCRKASDAALRFISRFQYQLTKDPALRKDVGKNGGLCPFHTWMYESVGSPQGIAQGYAAVLETLGLELQQVEQAENINQVSRELKELLPNRKPCRICQITSKAESRALDEVLQIEISSGRRHNLCMIHLGTLIEEVTNLETARSWIGREAVQLQRLAEDMRQFALKHSALRQHLSTAAERDAYLRGLMQLVGVRQLSFVRQIQDLL